MSKAVIRAFPSWQEGLKTRNQCAKPHMVGPSPGSGHQPYIEIFPRNSLPELPRQSNPQAFSTTTTERCDSHNQAADQISSIKHPYTTSTGPSVQMLRTVLPSLSNRSGLLPVVPISIHPPSLLPFCSR